jgi:SAM-dependent methyltransferase
MQVHSASLSTVLRYLETEGQVPLDVHERDFRKVLQRVSRFHPLEAGTRLLEVGIGTGWFLVLCARNGLECVGQEISPEMIAFVRKRAEQNGVSLELRLGNIEETPLGREAFDVVIAESVFEHVEDWRRALANVAASLRPGGVLIFSSTNRFSLRSGEFPPLPFYGWLPNRIRYWLRRTLEGPDVMRLGIDFHQFTYGTVRRAMLETGFSRVCDIADLLDPERLNKPTWWKVALLRGMRRSRTVRRITLTFWPETELVAIK